MNANEKIQFAGNALVALVVYFALISLPLMI